MKKVKLGEVTINIDNRRKPLNNLQRSEKSFSKKYPYCGANNIIDYIDEYIFDENEEILCIAEDGGNWGKDEECTYVMNEKCWVNNHAHVLKMKTGVDINYIKLTLDYLDLTPYITGSTRGKLTKSSLDKVEINLPNYHTQISISKKISDIQKLIIKKEMQIQKFNELVKSRFNEMFGDIFDTAFPIYRLEELCEFIKDGTHQTPQYTDDRTNGFKFLSSKDVTSGKISWENIKYITESLHNELYSKISPRRNDILLAKNGTTGIAALVDCDEIFDIYVSLAILRFYDGNNPTYLLYAINSDATKWQFESKLKGVGVPNLHLREIRKTKISLPPLSLQNEFADFVAKVDKSQLAIQKSLEELETLKKSLMQEYFG